MLKCICRAFERMRQECGRLWADMQRQKQMRSLSLKIERCQCTIDEGRNALGQFGQAIQDDWCQLASLEHDIAATEELAQRATLMAQLDLAHREEHLQAAKDYTEAVSRKRNAAQCLREIVTLGHASHERCTEVLRQAARKLQIVRDDCKTAQLVMSCGTRYAI